MNGVFARFLVSFCVVTLLAAAVHAAPVQLSSVAFPERRAVEMPLLRTDIAPAAQVSTVVEFHKGQAEIDLTYSAMKPAILFGGDITCFVVWAVTRDGQAENLGELLTRKKSGKLSFQTGKKSFALMVTAESYYLVGRPSELVVFRNSTPSMNVAVSTRFSFDDFEPAPRHNMDAIAHLIWDSSVPLELLQARKAYEVAGRHDAEVHASRIYREAGAALKYANTTFDSAPKSRELLDHAQRAVALSNEALNISMQRIEAIEVERKLAERRAETEALEQRAAEAEAATEEARRVAAEVRAANERTMAETAALRQEKTALEAAMIALRQEKGVLQGESERLIVEKAALVTEAERLRAERKAQQAEALRIQRERDELAGRLQSALSHVAETQDSARGYVVNLPDILFDVDEATLKPEAQLVIAKLAGILLIMPDKQVTIEGHTDSTGSAEYNLDLSQRRAVSVMGLMQSQGIDSNRLRAIGYGMQRPVAENATADGRSRNRRVEIVISEGNGGS
jgi:outer membrane protein OmpA-like peptidoglycan-associated protein